MKVAIYARVSKSDRDDPTSVPVQVADCRERAEEEGWEVIEEYLEDPVSAWNPRKVRPEYERLLADVEAGRVEAILVREQERLLRQMKDAIRVQDLASRGWLKLIASTMESDINFKRARDRDDFRKRASQAEFYSDFLSEKVRRTKAVHSADGTYSGGERHPFGYRRTTTGLEVEPEQAALLHEAVRRLHRGDSLYRIVVDWNLAGITTANGARWRPKTLRRMLTDGHLIGERGYPRILDDVEASIAATALQREPTPAPGRPTGRRYALTGFLFCAECGSKLMAGSGAYRCGVPHGGCGAVSVKSTPLERHLLAEAIRRPTKKSSPRTDPARDTEPIMTELRQVETDIEDTRSLAGDGTLRPADAAPILKDLAERQRNLTDELARILPPPKTELPPYLGWASALLGEYTRVSGVHIPDVDPAFTARWEARELTEVETMQLREVFTGSLERATIGRRERRGRSFDATRVKPIWKDDAA